MGEGGIVSAGHALDDKVPPRGFLAQSTGSHRTIGIGEGCRHVEAERVVGANLIAVGGGHVLILYRSASVRLRGMWFVSVSLATFIGLFALARWWRR